MRQLDETTKHILEDIAMGLGENDMVTNLVMDDDVIPDLLDPYRNSNRVSNSKHRCEAVSNLLSKDLMRMSFRDRTLISEELHGVLSLAIKENDDDFTKQNALIELNQILEHRIPVHEKTAFLKAQSLEKTMGTYVNDDEFRMKFLRCKLFNVDEAAQLLINYLELVRELYGDICLSRSICLEDVQTTKEERAAFRSGYIQLLPFGDRAGRRILMITTDALFYSTYIRVKIFLYIWTVASNDVATQQNGAILICWDGRKDMPLPRPSEQQLVKKLFMAIPLRICGIHFCFPDSPFYRMARAIFTLTIGAVEHRNRLRFHIGEETELKYQVGTFGVPVSQIPITETGNIKRGSFQKWIGMRMIVEERQATELSTQRQRRIQIKMEPYLQTQQSHWHIQSQTKTQTTEYMTDKKILPTPSFVEHPGLNDVAFRKGVSLMHHPGNDYFHGLIQSKIFEHENESQTGKSRITWWVVDEIRSREGRFLSWDQQCWWVVLEDDSKIRSRVAVAFREWKKCLKAEKNRQTMSTSSMYAYKFRRLQNGEREKSCSSSDEPDGIFNNSSQCKSICHA